MPYIKQGQRESFRKMGESGHNPKTENSGELNYELTLKCLKYIKINGESYKTLNDIIGALECCKQEFYRRVVVEFEEKKRSENGDVYS